MPKKLDDNATTAGEAAASTTTTTTETADAPATEGGKKKSSGGTQLDPKTGKIMTPEQKAKAAAKKEKEEAKKAETEAKKQAKAEKEKAKAEAAEAKEKEKADKAAAKEKEKADKKAITDALKADCARLGLRFAKVREFIQGNQLSVGGDGSLVIADAAGNNPMGIEKYMAEFADEQTMEEAKKTGRSRGPGKPREPRVHPSELGVRVTQRTEPKLQIDPAAPWATLMPPTVLTVNVQDVQIGATTKTEGEGDKAKTVVDLYTLTAGDQAFGPFNREGFRDLGWFVNWKVDFMDKLATDPALACSVANHLVKRHRPQLFGFAKDASGQIMDSFPGLRDPLGHAEAVQAAANALSVATGAAVAMELTQTDKGFSCKLGGGQAYPLPDGTQVRVGVEVFHRYGIDLAVRLCLLDQDKYALVSNDVVYMWTGGDGGTVEGQLKFIEEAVVKVLATAGDAVAAMTEMDAATWTMDKAKAAFKETNIDRTAVEETLKSLGEGAKPTMLQLLRTMSETALAMGPFDKRTAQRTLGEWATKGGKLKKLAERGARVVQGN